MEYISNVYRVWFLSFNFIIIYISFLLAIIFFTHALKYTGDIIKRTNFAMGIMALMLGINFILDIIYPYFQESDVDTRRFFYSAVSICVIITVYVVELLFRSRRFYIYPLGIACISVILLDPDSDWILIPLLLSIFFIIFALQFFQFLLLKTGGRTRKKIKSFMAFLLLTYFGSIMNVDWLVKQIGNDWFLILGYAVVLIGDIGMFFSFRRVDVFLEAGWNDYLEGVYIIDKISNKLIYSKILSSNLLKSNTPDSLLSSGLVGINSIIKEITGQDSQRESLQGIISIEKEGKYILLEHLQNELLCSIATKQMESTRYFLQKIRDAWILYYNNWKAIWKNDSPEFFLPMDSIIDQILIDRMEERQ